MTVEKPKPKQLLRPITTEINSTMNQSQFLAICHSLKAREKSHIHGAIGFGFTVPCKCKLTVSSQNSILDARSSLVEKLAQVFSAIAIT